MLKNQLLWVFTKANGVFNWSQELEPSPTWTVFPFPSKYELLGFCCRYHPPLYNLPWSARSWPDIWQQIPTSLKNKMFFRADGREKKERVLGWGEYSSVVSLSNFSDSVIHMKKLQESLSLRKRLFFQRRGGRTFWREEYPLKIKGEKNWG